jgi:hypothetical protein
MSLRLLDLFCGRWGWSRAFAARNWECDGIDLVSSPLPAANAHFTCADVLDLTVAIVKRFEPDFIVASPPCDEFACFQMKHFRKDPPYPMKGIELFNHTRALCELSGIPHVIENVRAAQEFVGKADGHAGSFYLWGNAVPPILPRVYKAKWTANVRHGRTAPGNFAPELNLPKSERKPLLAVIPLELANCVADYAERILEQKARARSTEAVSLDRPGKSDSLPGGTS